MTSEKNDSFGKNQVQTHETFIKEPVALITIASFFLWSLLITFSLYWNTNNIQDQKIALATEQARNNWNKDQAFRGWASKHGGLYVKVDQRTPPNPYLSHLPNRDIISNDGTQLTLMNPAYMMRQMTEEYEDSYGIKGRITGKVVLNPINVADEWELKALKRFEEGDQEVIELTNIGGEEHLRLMKPIVMEKNCIQCHGHLGFKVGDTSSGVSVSIPIKPYAIAMATTKKSMIITHALVWVFGFGVAFVFFRSANKRNDERYTHQEALLRYQEDLQEQVLLRTKELKLKELEAKEGSQRLSKIMNTVVDSIITTNEHGIIETFNAASEKMFGYSAQEVVGKNINLLMNQADHKVHDQHINRYLNTGKANVIGMGREVIARRKDGSEFWVNAAVSALKLENNIVFTGILHDVTKQKETENALLQAKESAESANLAKSEFLSSMSHELRTPLNAILGFAQLLEMNKKKPLDQKQKSSVTHIIQGGRYLLELINSVLDLAKIEAGKVDLAINDIKVDAIIEQCFKLVQPTAADNDVELKSTYDSSADLAFRADATRTKQILLNLLSNAIKYNQPGGSITVSCHASSADMLRIEVKDTGKGIPEEKQSELFKPFNRLGAERSNVKGTGIGLSVCKELVVLMKGRIGIESKAGLGSSFWFELPIAVDKHKPWISINPEAKPTTQPIQTPSKINASLLYVEDNEASIQLMEAICTTIEGLELITARNAADGIKIAKAYIPDAIIFDVNLPEISGLEAVACLRQSPETAKIPVIALSAAAMQADIDRGINAGFNVYLTKPIQIDTLLATLDEIIKPDDWDDHATLSQNLP